jgi:hypothetical protein
MRSPCPPLPIDAALTSMIESYRRAKSDASNASTKRASIESAGHYDRDASTPRPVVEEDAALAERRAAVALADALLGWIDRHRA